MAEAVTIGSKSYTLGTSMPDSLRRRQHFINETTAELTEVEDAILTDLGIDATMKNSLRPYLADFFDALPSCNTDSKLYLSKQCEVPYYVLWSVFFANRRQIEQKLERETKKPMEDLERAEITQMTRNFSGGKKLDKYEKLFELIMLDEARPSPELTESEARTVDDLFTLIITTEARR